MELGSEICRPRDPQCDDCPLAKMCRANLHDEQYTLPERDPGKPLPSQTVVVAVIYRAGRILIDKRKPEGLLGGLWEFPGGKQEPGESLAAALRREVKEELGVRIRIGKLLAVVDHAYSHFRVRIHAFECAHAAGRPRCITCADFKWVRPQDLSRYAFPAATNKIIRILHAGKPVR